MKETSEAMYLSLPKPHGWKQSLFGDLISQISTSNKKINGKEYLVKGKYPVVDQGQEFISGYFNNSKHLISEKSPVIVFGDHTRVVKYLETPFVPGADGVKAFVPASEGIEPRFLYYLTVYLSQLFPSKGYARHFQHIEKSKVSIPDPKIQRHISSKIDSLFSDISNGDKEMEMAKQKLDLYRQTILSAAIRGELVSQNPNDEPASRLLEKINIKKAAALKEGKVKKEKPLRPIDQKELAFDLPNGWEWARIRSISRRVTVGFVGKMKDQYVPAGVPFFRSQNIRPFQFDYEGLKFISKEFNKSISKSQLKGGDVAIVRTGFVGQSCVVPDEFKLANCSDLVIVQEPYISPQLITIFLNGAAQVFIHENKVGVAQSHFNTETVANMLIPIPPKAEQSRICSAVENALESIKLTEKYCIDLQSKSELLKRSILKKAFESKL